MDASYPTPAIVGKAFVKQYYTQMHRDPSQLHRFYLEQSSFVYGGADIGSEDPVLGQKSINDKIKSLNLSQVHAKIKQVDSHATLGNGIVVQVTGELSTGGRPMRSFVQTFVLAPESPKKYYVHNDIFRYQEDDLSESETNEAPGDGEPPGQMLDAAEEGLDYSSAPSSLPVPNADGGKVGGVGDPEVALYPSQGSAGMSEQGLPQTEVNDVGGVTDGWGEQQPFEETPHLRQNGLPEEVEPPQDVAVVTEDYSMEPVGHVATVVGAEQGGGDMGLGGGAGGGVVGGRFSSQDAHKEDTKAPLSWAGRLSKQAPGSAQNRPLNSMSMSTGSQALPQREPSRPRRAMAPPSSTGPSSSFPPSNPSPNPHHTSTTPTSSTTATTPKDPPSSSLPPPNTSKKNPQGLTSRDAPDNWQIFVGGLPPQASEADIRSVFSKYNSIAEVRVNPKNFAFVVFTGPEPVEQIIANKDHFNLKGKHLNIEPKRHSGSRFRGADRNKPYGGGGGGGMGGKMRSGGPEGGGGGAGGGGGSGGGRGGAGSKGGLKRN